MHEVTRRGHSARLQHGGALDIECGQEGRFEICRRVVASTLIITGNTGNYYGRVASQPGRAAGSFWGQNIVYL